MMLTNMIAQLIFIEVITQQQLEDPYLWKIYEEMEVNLNLTSPCEMELLSFEIAYVF